MMERAVRRLEGRCLTLLAGAVVVAGAACSDIPSDPKAAFSIEFNRAPSPSVVLGETMFDSLGNQAPLKARVFNAQGDEIVGAAVTYHVVAYDSVLPSDSSFRDSVPLTVDATSGIVTGKTAPQLAGKRARVYAQAGKLQSQAIRITATRTADELLAAGPVTDSVTLSFITLDTLFVPPASFSVRLRHTPVGTEAVGDTTVPAYLVRYKIVKPAGAATDTSYVMLTSGDTKRSELDTTDVSGIASHKLRIRRVNFPFSNAPDTSGFVRDTIVVEARAYRAGGDPVPGSGLQFTLIIKAKH
ncbi:MAG: hypothetical protein ACJ79K_09525 [Gemmatimonadaceae bacterium]